MYSKYPSRASRARPIALECVKLAFWIKNLMIGTKRTFAYTYFPLLLMVFQLLKRTNSREKYVGVSIINIYTLMTGACWGGEGSWRGRWPRPPRPYSHLPWNISIFERQGVPFSFSDRYMVHTGRVFQNYCVSFHVFYWASPLRALLSPARNVFSWFILVTLWRPMRDGKLLWQIPVVVYLFFDIFRTH